MSTVSEVRDERVNVIRVTEPGVKGDPSRCGIAKVLKTLNPQFSYVKVGKKTISATDKAARLRYTWATPLSVRTAIQKHDADGVAEFPMFELRPSEAATKPLYAGRSGKVEQVKVYDKEYRAKVASGEHAPKQLTAAQRRARQRGRRNG